MAVFSVNQNRQFYVAKKVVAKNTEVKDAGDILVKATKDFDKEVYFEVKGADKETVLRSDRIPVKNISYVKLIKAADMATPMKKVNVTLKTDVNEGKLIVGQDYVLRIAFRQFYGMSDQDQYFKDVAVHAYKGMDAAAFYKELKDALNLSFAREIGATKESNPYLTFTASATALTIEEKPQPWNLGTETQERVYFEIVPTTVYDGVDDLVWGKAEEQAASTTLGNGKKIADLEYFCLGERGDQYRKVGFPNDIETKGVVDPDKDYDVMEIHYSFTDDGVNSYKSEKDITIVTPSEGGSTFAVNDALVTAFNAATGLTIKTLSAIEQEKKASLNTASDPGKK